MLEDEDLIVPEHPDSIDADVVYSAKGIEFVKFEGSSNGSNGSNSNTKQYWDDYYEEKRYNVYVKKICKIHDNMKDYCKYNDLPFLDYAFLAFEWMDLVK